MNKWESILKLSLVTLGAVLAVYYLLSQMSDLIVRRNNDIINVSVSREMEIPKKRREKSDRYETFLAEAQRLQFRRDPFARNKIEIPVVQELPAEGPLVLQGIMMEKGQAHPKAMINGEVVEIGSFIDHFMVIVIDKDHVVLMDKDPGVPESERRIELWINAP